MKNYALLSLVVLVGLSGCNYRKKKEQRDNKRGNQVVAMKDNVAIPLANEDHDFLLDENLDQLIIADAEAEYAREDGAENYVAAIGLDDEYSWTEEEAASRQFKNIYFAFDSYEISRDQEDSLGHDIAVAKRAVDEYLLFGDAKHKPVIIIDGNSCHSAGSKAYNLVLSEQRAEALQERFVAAGIAREYIKIVGRGSEVPALQDGKAVTGDREQQWANRRDEVRIVFS